MIGYIEGKLLKKDDNRILILANQIGYEVLLPAFVMETFKAKRGGIPLHLSSTDRTAAQACVDRF